MKDNKTHREIISRTLSSLKGDARHTIIDNNPQSTAHGRLKNMIMSVNTTAKPDIIQQKISYKRGDIKNEDELKGKIGMAYPSVHKDRINELIEFYKNEKDTYYGSQAFNYACQTLEKEGYGKPRFYSPSTGKQSTHGAQIPFQIDERKSASPDSVRNTFDFPSVTLARMSFIDVSQVFDFHARSHEKDLHAEDSLIEQLQQFIDENSSLDLTKVRLNLTINNFPCSEESTKKTDVTKNCLDKLIAFYKMYGFAGFHIYFTNAYGKNMQECIRRLQAENIKVTSFMMVGATHHPFYSDLLDPPSQSDEDVHETDRLIDDEVEGDYSDEYLDSQVLLLDDLRKMKQTRKIKLMIRTLLALIGDDFEDDEPYYYYGRLKW